MMGRKNKKLKVKLVPQATEVDIDFRITIQEVHCRTGIVCEKRSRLLSFSLERDFEKAADWLKSDDVHTLFDDLCAEIGLFVDLASEDSQ